MSNQTSFSLVARVGFEPTVLALCSYLQANPAKAGDFALFRLPCNVPMVGVEPTSLIRAPDFESGVVAIFHHIGDGLSAGASGSCR